MKITKFVLIFILLLCIQSCNCNKGIKDLVINRENMENCFNFKVTIYYNSPYIFRDSPLEIGRIRDGEYEEKTEWTLYEKSLDLFLNTYFPDRIEIVNNPIKYNECMNNISSFCEIRNDNNQLLYWIIPQPKNEEFMIINGKLIKNIDTISELLIIQ